jgi:hypothetical protein
MAGLIACFGKLRLKTSRTEPFEALCEAVVYQQLHAKAASTIFTRIGRWTVEMFLMFNLALPHPRRLLPLARSRHGVSRSFASSLTPVGGCSISVLLRDAVEP